MSNDMTNPDFLVLVSNISLLVYLGLLFGVAIWALQARLPSRLKTNYPRRITFMSQMPLAFRWREQVSKEDLPVFEKARQRQHAFLIAVASMIPLLSFYAYVRVVAQLFHCNMQGINLIQ
jgi:hypothetical protein